MGQRKMQISGWSGSKFSANQQVNKGMRFVERIYTYSALALFALASGWQVQWITTPGRGIKVFRDNYINGCGCDQVQ
jgi:hypothetical protein